MGTIADKLAKLNSTKADLKAALAEKGQIVGDVFSTYPAAVRRISGAETASVTFVDYQNGSGFIVFFYDAEGIIHQNLIEDEGFGIKILPRNSLVVAIAIETPSSSVGAVGEASMVLAQESGGISLFIVGVQGDSEIAFST